jgi:hypothetical protein
MEQLSEDTVSAHFCFVPGTATAAAMQDQVCIVSMGVTASVVRFGESAVKLLLR